MLASLKSLLRLHVFLAISFAVMGIFAVVGCRLTATHLTEAGPVLLIMGVLLAAYAPVPVWWHQKGRFERRDAALMIPWSIAILLLVPVPLAIAARFALPLQDQAFFAFDRMLGVHTAVVASLAPSHPLGRLLNSTYGLLLPYLEAAVFFPALLGRRESIRFLLANVVAFYLGTVLLIFLPAIGPWAVEPFQPSAAQLATQVQMLALRHPGPLNFSVLSDGAAIIAFPSFHVIWAVLALSAFWGYRLLRIPLAVLSAMICFSTLTTGWHYLADGLGGMAVAVLSLWAAEFVLGFSYPHAAKAMSRSQ